MYICEKKIKALTPGEQHKEPLFLHCSTTQCRSQLYYSKKSVESQANSQSDFFGRDGVVPGSAEEIAIRHREQDRREAEKLIDEVSEDFPSLGRIYDILKEAKR